MTLAFKPMGTITLISILLIVVQQFGANTVNYQKTILLRKSSQETLSTVNILLGLSGNHSGFLAEFEVALKSILLNAPLESDLSIYIMADSDAYGAMGEVFDRTGLNGSAWRNQIFIETYNVAPYLGNWTRQIKSMSENMDFERHTIGAYFRLYAHDVLPNNVKHALYMDTDVVIMANLDDLWEHVDQDALFQWGKDTCDGFIILNVQKLDTIWDMARRCNLENISKATHQAFNDQLIFRAVNHTFPDVVAVLPEEWAISVANGAWMYAQNIVEARPKVGMFHFNGGGSSKDVYWESSFVQKFADTWGTGPNYYAKLPWNWVRFIGESMRGAGKGNPLIIRHEGTRNKTTT